MQKGPIQFSARAYTGLSFYPLPRAWHQTQMSQQAHSMLENTRVLCLFLICV